MRSIRRRNNLKRILKRLGIKQKELAGALNMDPASVSRIAQGWVNPHWKVQAKIAAFLSNDDVKVTCQDVWPDRWQPWAKGRDEE